MQFVFPWTSVDSIVSGLNRQVAKLEAVADKHSENAKTYSALAVRLAKKAEEHMSEENRAKRIANKFKDLVS
jgi:alpha-D-ribose 1-methylphosphonate 5-triphosphate synthase subunit PhnG